MDIVLEVYYRFSFLENVVGAFLKCIETNPSINLFADDGGHHSWEGSYLAALTIYATIFNEDPTGISFRSTFTAENAAILQEAAKNAVFNTPEIPKAYQTTVT